MHGLAKSAIAAGTNSDADMNTPSISRLLSWRVGVHMTKDRDVMHVVSTKNSQTTDCRASACKGSRILLDFASNSYS